ncbi:MAG: hypothetical protein GX878_01800 [Firmicutes bacterium]|nr:hypothetical protein [Bacillota bacterium]
MKFRLQRVLDLRSAQEKIAQQELADRKQDYEMVLGRIDGLLEDEKTLFGFIKQQNEPGIDLLRLKHLCTYSDDLKNELVMQEVKRQKSLRLVEQQQNAVRECWQKRRMLEILQSKAAAAFMDLLKKEEQKQIDELVLFSFTEKKEQ